MSESESSEDATLTASRFYGLMGEFCVVFEGICQQMEDCASTVLERNGLKSHAIHKVILANLTAEPLQRILRALLAEHFGSKDYDKVLSTTFGAFEKLTTTRNGIVHGKWMAPIEDDNWRTTKSHVLSMRLKTSKSGADPEFLRFSEKDFQGHIAECHRLTRAFSSLAYLVAFPDLLEKHFNKSNGKLMELK